MEQGTFASAPLKAASIGLGWWSDALAASIASDRDKIQIVACTSRSQPKRAAFEERFGARGLASYEEVLAHSGVDAVILTTPHSMHGEHVRMAARAGKHVFVEKPLTLEASDGQRAADACHAAGVTLAVGHNRRFASGAHWLKQQIADGSLGTLLHIEANFSAPGALAYTADRWRANRIESPGGGIAGLGIHMIDLMCWLAGPVAAVNARAVQRAVTVDMDDTTSALFQFASGPTGYLGTCFACPYTTYVTVYGTKGNAHIDLDGNTGWFKPAGGGAAIPQTFDAHDTLRLELEEFADACRGRTAFRVTPDEAIHDVAVMQAMVASSAQGGTPVDPRRFQEKTP
jgi:predicted dehydrogenase